MPRITRVQGDHLGGLLYELDFSLPKSAWLDHEKKLFSDLVQSAAAEVLLVPCQVTQRAFDRVERLLVTLRVNQLLTDGGLKTIDPFLVARALGEGQRTIADDDVKEFAAAVGAKRVLRCYLGRDPRSQGKFHFVLAWQEDQRFIKRTWDELEFNDVQLPNESIREVEAEVRAFLQVESSNPLPLIAAESEHQPTLPDSPQAMLGGEPVSELEGLYHLAFLAGLYPSVPERGKERLVERLLLATERLPPDSDHTRFLKAWSFKELSRRPAALVVLGNASNPAEKALVAVLNGNLPALETATAKVKEPIRRFLLDLETFDMRFDYEAIGVEEYRVAVDIFVEKFPAWRDWIRHRLLERDRWSTESDVVIKRQLDRFFPVEGYKVEDILGGQMVLGGDEISGMDLELSVQHHFSKLLALSEPDLGARPDLPYPTKWDMLNLATADAEHNIWKQLGLFVELQGLPERAYSYLKDIERQYAGHPAVEARRYQISAARLEDLSGSERQTLVEPTLAALRTALWLAQGQTISSNLVDNPGDDLPFSYEDPWTAISRAYVADFPGRYYWSAGIQEERESNTLARIAYASTNFSPIWNRASMLRIQGRFDELRSLLAETEGRYIGSPRRLEGLGQIYENIGEHDKALEIYRQAVDSGSGSWTPYLRLAELMVEGSEHSKAEQTISAYPGFGDDQTESRVFMSNVSATAGSLFFWRGDLERALRFYSLGAQYGSGSEGHLISEHRKALIEGRYREAASSALAMAGRYQSPYAYADYLVLLSVLGFSDEAEVAFETLLTQFDQLEVWSAEIIRQRVAGASDLETVSWLSQERIRASRIGALRFAPRSALLAGVVDRNPGDELVRLVEDLDSPSFTIAPHGGRHVVRSATGEFAGQPIVGPSSYKGFNLVPIDHVGPVRSELAYFAEAYVALRNTDYPAALQALEDGARFYDYASGGLEWILPYFVFAAVNAGERGSVESYLSGIEPEERGFDYYLARAYAAASDKAHEEAGENLDKALGHRLHTWLGTRPIFVAYQYAEACEWMYRHSGEDTYLKRLLAWARSVQKMEPWTSWAFAMEAQYTQDQPLSANMTETLTPLGITVGRWRFNRWQQREKRWH